MSKYLVIGLGSMGKRRVRCLAELGISYSDIIGMDIREDRCSEAESKYGIKVFRSTDEIDFEQIEAVIVSLPPDKHIDGVNTAARFGKPVFVEASVVLDDVKKIKEVSTDIFVAPSCTFFFHPMIQKMKSIIDSQEYGKVCNFSYHSGQYLPDWHPWEDVNDYYVGNRLTGGAREIVPYELTWITKLFGYPEGIKGYYRKTMDIGCNIEDSYSCTLAFGDKVGTLLVDVVSRAHTRDIILNMEYGQIQWRADMERLRIYDARSKETSFVDQDQKIHVDGYSSIISENSYIEEIRAFLRGIADSSAFPNTIDDDIRVLELLKSVEDSDGGFDR